MKLKMTKSYSEDLRKKVIEYLTEGNSYDKTSKLFKISVSAIGRWYRKYKKEGNYEAKRRGGSKRKIDLELLQHYVESNENMTLKAASKIFKVSIFTISYWLKRLGYSYKKKTSPTWRRIKKSEITIKK
jgi:transposase